MVIPDRTLPDLPNAISEVVLRPEALMIYTEVIQPAVRALSLPEEPTACMLILGTMMQESGGMKYIRQLGTGPALGFFQMEPRTFDYLWGKYGANLERKLGECLNSLLVPADRPVRQLTYNLRFAAAMCRVHYFDRPFSLKSPTQTSVEDLAVLWKTHYNTSAGAGTVRQFMASFAKYVGTI